MSRLTIDISPEQHRSLKALAALEGKTIRQYALERLFPARGGKPRAVDGEEDGPHRVITLGDLIDKPEAEMDPQERAAWANFCAFLEERAAEADAEPPSTVTIDDIFRRVLREEGHAFE